MCSNSGADALNALHNANGSDTTLVLSFSPYMN